MPHPVEGFLEVYEDMIEILLILKVVLVLTSETKYWLRNTSTCSEMRLSADDDLQHYLAWVANETDCSIVLALL